jgi:alkane 1-monooxygenase
MLRIPVVRTSRATRQPVIALPYVASRWPHVDAIMRFLPHLLAATTIVGYLTGTVWAFGIVGWIQLSVPLLDHAVGIDTRPRVDNEGRIASLAIWAFVPLHVALVACGVSAAAVGALDAGRSPVNLVQVAIVVGAIGGMCAAPVAHELMHRSGWWATAVAELQMALITYPHFCIEHVEGHHVRVATPADPATAVAGESVYQFYPRAVCKSVASAWRLESLRLARAGCLAVSARNRMIRYAALELCLYAAIALLSGWRGTAFFAVQSVIAFSIVETINYVEHYGLRRREISPGCYEPVTPEHAWNSSYRLSNWLMFNVARHSDHHCHSHRVYASLRHVDHAPQLPAGYLSMFVLALVPPLWRRVMDPRVAMWNRSRRPLEGV